MKKYFVLLILLQGILYIGITCTENFTAMDEAEEILKSLNDSLKNVKKILAPKCPIEEFIHDYIIEDKLESFKNEWLETFASRFGMLKHDCRDNNGLPVRRKCIYTKGENGEKSKAVWEPIANWERIKCIDSNYAKSEETTLETILNRITNNSHDLENVTAHAMYAYEVRTIFENRKKLLAPADILTTSRILETFSAKNAESGMPEEFVGICNKLIASPKQSLRLSASFNATNEFLDTFENFMDTSIENIKFLSKNQFKNISEWNSTKTYDYPELCVRKISSENISVFYIKPYCSNITGISLYTYNKKKHKKWLHYDSLGNFSYRFLYENTTIGELMSEADMDVATFLPKNLLNEVEQKIDKKKLWIVLKIYAGDQLFVDNNRNILAAKPMSNVISISIPGLGGGTMNTTLPFILRGKNINRDPCKTAAYVSGCAYWNYSTWTHNGVQTNLSNMELSSENQEIVLCSTRHLTSFTYLAAGALSRTNFGDEMLPLSTHKLALDYISIIGCSLSLFGLVSIYIKACFSRSWRNMASTKLLLNVCVVLTIQMVLFISFNIPKIWIEFLENDACIKCIVLGALMQYLTLVIFTWMLIIAYLQYKRYVVVLANRSTNHQILKSALIAWGFPLLPTLLVVSIDCETYSVEFERFIMGDGLCYPSGYSLIFGVVLPITIICLINCMIFFYIFYSISRTLDKSMESLKQKIIVQQIRLALLLFFQLGLTWITGILTIIETDILFSYIFCFSATLQGFMLFLYYVVFQSRDWLRVFCPSKMLRRNKKQGYRATN